MLLHTGDRFQTGRGIGSLFSGLFRTLKPLVSMGLSAGKKILTSDLARKVGSTALDIGKDTLKNVAADIIEGKEAKDSLNKGLETAKATIASQICGSGRKRRRIKRNCRKPVVYKRSKYNLLEEEEEEDDEDED